LAIVFVSLLTKQHTMKLFVAGLSPDFDDIDLKEMFELYGEVASAKLIVDRQTGKSKGFGFVDMPDDNDARQTIEALDGANLKGKQMSVKQAEEQQQRGGGGGSYGGGGGGNRWNNNGGGSSGGYNKRPPYKKF